MLVCMHNSNARSCHEFAGHVAGLFVGVHMLSAAAMGFFSQHMSFQSFLDDRESFHTTYKLVYSDLQGSPQQAVAMHITEEGLKLRCVSGCVACYDPSTR